MALNEKTQLELMIDENGIDFVAAQLALLLNEKIDSIKIARQFVLEELDAASQGNDDSQSFVSQCGIEPNDYKWALKNSFDEEDGANGPQQFLSNLLISQLGHDRDFMANVRCHTVDHVMKNWNLGKYHIDVTNARLDSFAFDNSEDVISAPKGTSKLIALLRTIEIMLHNQQWHIQKIDYGANNEREIVFAVVGQAYLKFNGPDLLAAKQVEASRSTLGIIEEDLEVLPTVMLQLAFNFYRNDIEVEMQLFDSRSYGGYNAINRLYSLVGFSRDEFLGSFANINPDTQLERLLKQLPLYDTKLLFTQTFNEGPTEVTQHLPAIMDHVRKLALQTILSL